MPNESVTNNPISAQFYIPKSGRWPVFVENWKAENAEKGPLPGFCPVSAQFLKQKWAAKKPRKIKGFSHFCPVSQFFLLFNTIKIFNKIREVTKKTGQSGQNLFLIRRRMKRR